MAMQILGCKQHTRKSRPTTQAQPVSPACPLLEDVYFLYTFHREGTSSSLRIVLIFTNIQKNKTHLLSKSCYRLIAVNECALKMQHGSTLLYCSLEVGSLVSACHTSVQLFGNSPPSNKKLGTREMKTTLMKYLQEKCLK